MGDGNPTPGIFDGMAAYRGPARHHDPDPQPREPLARRRDPGRVPTGKRYDPDLNVRGGNTKLVVDQRPAGDRAASRCSAARTRTAPAASTPWDIVDHLRGDLQLRLGGGQRDARHRGPARLRLRGPGRRGGPVDAAPITAAGRFSHEAVAWLDGILYETEDRGDAAFYRFIPDRPPREFGDLARSAARSRRSWSAAGRTSTPTPPTRATRSRSSG